MFNNRSVLNLVGGLVNEAAKHTLADLRDG